MSLGAAADRGKRRLIFARLSCYDTPLQGAPKRGDRDDAGCRAIAGPDVLTWMMLVE